MLTSFLAAAALSTTSIVHAFSPDPGQGKMYIGMWPDIAEGFYDTPAAANARLGINFPVFQLAQTIPLPAYNWDTGAGGEALFSEVDASATDAAYFITVCKWRPFYSGNPEPMFRTDPDTEDGIEAVTDGDLVQLADQIARCRLSLRVFKLAKYRVHHPSRSEPRETCVLEVGTGDEWTVRYLPFHRVKQLTDKAHRWKSYGVQPTAFKALWERMHTIVKQIAPDTTIVWAPNSEHTIARN